MRCIVIRRLLISRRYAASFLAYAHFANADITSIHSELKEFCALCNQVTKLKALFMNRALPIFIKVGVWDSIAHCFELSALAKAVVLIFIKNGRSEILVDFVNDLELLWLQQKGGNRVYITLADIKMHNVIETLKSEIEEVAPFSPSFAIIEDRSIIGGAIIAWDSYTVDMSVRGKIDRMLSFMEICED